MVLPLPRVMDVPYGEGALQPQIVLPVVSHHAHGLDHCRTGGGAQCSKTTSEPPVKGIPNIGLLKHILRRCTPIVNQMGLMRDMLNNAVSLRRCGIGQMTVKDAGRYPVILGLSSSAPPWS